MSEIEKVATLRSNEESLCWFIVECELEKYKYHPHKNHLYIATVFSLSALDSFLNHLLSICNIDSSINPLPKNNFNLFNTIKKCFCKNQNLKKGFNEGITDGIKRKIKLFDQNFNFSNNDNWRSVIELNKIRRKIVHWDGHLEEVYVVDDKLNIINIKSSKGVRLEMNKVPHYIKNIKDFILKDLKNLGYEVVKSNDNFSEPFFQLLFSGFERNPESLKKYIEKESNNLKIQNE